VSPDRRPLRAVAGRRHKTVGERDVAWPSTVGLRRRFVCWNPTLVPGCARGAGGAFRKPFHFLRARVLHPPTQDTAPLWMFLSLTYLPTFFQTPNPFLYDPSLHPCLVTVFYASMRAGVDGTNERLVFWRVMTINGDDAEYNAAKGFAACSVSGLAACAGGGRA